MFSCPGMVLIRDSPDMDKNTTAAGIGGWECAFIACFTSLSNYDVLQSNFMNICLIVFGGLTVCFTLNQKDFGRHRINRIIYLIVFRRPLLRVLHRFQIMMCSNPTS